MVHDPIDVTGADPSDEAHATAAAVPAGAAGLDLRERIALAALEQRILGRSNAASLVAGRYVLLEELGTGGMGVVRKAFDDELKREVAVKFLRLGRRARGLDEARLQREAQALARLSHPNVVAVYDVRATDDAFFLAMEFVEGATLRDWLHARDRTPSAIVDVFAQAASGLSAAHAAGLVHRDFKPSNVMVGDDGRVRVVDFGLARHGDETREDDGGSPTEALGTVSSVERLTHTGLVMGTPGYAAPEQIAGGRVDERSDQFSWSVSLFEALFGRRPFEPAEIKAMATGHATTPTPRFPPGTPRWQRRVLQRGLAPRPEDRWPSMATIATAMRNPGGRARWAVGIVALGVAAAAVAWVAAPASPGGRCDAGAERIAVVWNARRAASVADAFRDTGLPYADAASIQVTSRLDGHARRWATEHRRACEASRAAADPSALALDRKMRCLGRRHTELAAVVDVLQDADATVVRRSSDVVGGLVSIDRCGPIGSGATEGPGVRDTSAEDSSEREASADAGGIERRLARTRALGNAGKIAQAEDEARAVFAAAQRHGDPRLLARARHRLGTTLESAGAYDESARELTKAYFDALHHGLRAVAADAATDLVLVEGERRGNPQQALEWARHARALLARLDVGMDPEIRLMQVEAVARGALGQFDEAVRLNLDVLDRLRSSPEADPFDRVWTHNNLGIVYQTQERFTEALTQHQRARELIESTFGSEHPDAAVIIGGIAGDLLGLGRDDEALDLFGQALRIREQTLGPRHPDVAASHNNVGVVLVELQRYDEAERHYRHGLEILQATAAETEPAVADLVYNLGNVHHFRGEHEAALLHYRRARRLHERIYGPGHPQVAASLNNIGVCHERMGQLDEAQRHHLQALRIREASLGPSSVGAARSRFNLGLVAAARDQLGPAQAHFERALAIGVQAHDDALAADARAELAKVAAAKRESDP